MHRIDMRFNGEGGQAVVLFAAGLVVMCAMVGMAIDFGHVYYTRTDLQKVADAAVFAGAQDLPSQGAATTSANNFVASNGSAGTTATVTIQQTYSANDTIAVTATRHVDFTFLKVIGMSGKDVSASAKARIGYYVGGAGLLPWGFVASNDSNSTLLQNPCYLGNDAFGVPQFKQNQSCTIKYGAGSSSGGDFGALSLGGTGGSVYRGNITHGSTLPFKVGDQVDSETGNVQGPTGQGISDRFALTAPSTCPGNARNQVLLTNADGSVSIRPGCESSPRIGLIPVVDKIQNPQKSTIKGFAYVYLSGSAGNGGQTQVNVEFVKFVTAIPGGVYRGTTGTGSSMVMLVQ